MTKVKDLKGFFQLFYLYFGKNSKLVLIAYIWYNNSNKQLI